MVAATSVGVRNFIRLHFAPMEIVDRESALPAAAGDLGRIADSART